MPANDDASVNSKVSDEGYAEFLRFLQSPSAPKANTKQQDEERGSNDEESQGSLAESLPDGPKVIKDKKAGYVALSVKDEASVKPHDAYGEFLMFLHAPSSAQKSGADTLYAVPDSMEEDGEKHLAEKFREGGALTKAGVAVGEKSDHVAEPPRDRSEKTADDSITPSPKKSLTNRLKLTSLIIGWIPSLFALAIVAFSVIILLSVLSLASIILLMAATIPIVVILRLLPQLQLMGYEQLSHSSTSSPKDNKALKTGWSRLRRLSSCQESTPWLSDVKTMLSLSDYVYLLSDFRKMSLTGKVPVEFKYLELECDRMDQWDIIKGKPHTRPAFDEHGKGHAGIRPSVLIVTILHFLINKAIRRGSSDDVEEKHVHHTAMEEEEFRGLNEFDRMFVGVVKCSSYSCDE